MAINVLKVYLRVEISANLVTLVGTSCMIPAAARLIIDKHISLFLNISLSLKFTFAISISLSEANFFVIT